MVLLKKEVLMAELTIAHAANIVCQIPYAN